MQFLDYQEKTPMEIVSFTTPNYSVIQVDEVGQTQDTWGIIGSALQRGISIVKDTRKKTHNKFPKLFA